MAWKPKAKRHCTVLVQKTVTNPLGQVQTNFIKRRPGVITSVVSGTTVAARVRHIGETYASVTQFRQHGVPEARNGTYYMG